MIRLHMLVGNNKEEARSGWKRDNDAIYALGNVMRLEVCVSWRMCGAPGAVLAREAVRSSADGDGLSETSSLYGWTSTDVGSCAGRSLLV